MKDRREDEELRDGGENRGRLVMVVMGGAGDRTGDGRWGREEAEIRE
jgi:hypothetical protein